MRSPIANDAHCGMLLQITLAGSRSRGQRKRIANTCDAYKAQLQFFTCHFPIIEPALRCRRPAHAAAERGNLEQSSQCACGSNAWLAHAGATWQYKLHSTAPPSHDQRKRIALDHGLATCSHSWQRTRIDEWDDTRSAPNAAARYIRLGLTHLSLPTECLNPSRAPLARPPQPRPRINHKWLARAFQPQAGMS